MQAPCGVKIKKNTSILFKGESCISSKSKISFDKNTKVAFNQLSLSAENKVDFGKNFKALGNSLSIDVISSTDDSDFLT